MKRLTLLLLLANTVFNSLAQNKIDFFDFVQSFDWKLSESAFKEKYKDRIQNSTDSIPDIYVATGSWLIKNVSIDKYETTTLVTYNPENQKPAIISLPDTEFLDSISYNMVCEDIERIVDRKFGNPELNLEDVDLGANAENLGFEKGNIKIWMSAAQIFMITAKNEEQRIILIEAVPQIEREPDFRQGFWGDSMADIKRKEGKANELDIDGIYAFTTYVAGLECLSAYRFTGNKLTSGKYVFLNSNSDNCMANYNMLVELLTKKYGKPFSNDKKTTAANYEQKLFTDGELVRNGDMQLETYWVTPFSTIAIFLYGEQLRISLSIEYYSNRFDGEREREVLKDL